MKRACVFSFFVLFAFVSFGQKKYMPGFMVTNEGDSIKGFVLVQRGSKVYSTCMFKSSLDAEPRNYSARSISSYGFDEGQLFLVLDDKSSETKFFTEVLVSGSASLYYDGDYEFMYKSHKVTLRNEDILNNDNVIVGKSNEYLAQLSTYLVGDCMSLSAGLSDVKLKHNSLIPFFLNFNECLGSKAKFHTTDLKTGSSAMFLSAGIGTGSLEFDEKNVAFFGFLNESNYRSTANIKAGIAVEKSLDRLKRLFVRPMLDLNYVVYEADYSTLDQERNWSYHRLSKIRTVLLMPSGSFIYKVPSVSVGLVVGGGFKLPLTTSQSNSNTVIDLANSDEVDSEPLDITLKSGESFLMLSLFKEFKDIVRLDLSYQHGFGFSESPAKIGSNNGSRSNSTSRTFFLTFGYRLN